MLMERVLPWAPASSMEGSWVRSFWKTSVGVMPTLSGSQVRRRMGTWLAMELFEEGGGESGDVFDYGGDDVGAAGYLGFDAGGGLGVEEPVYGGDHADELFFGDLHAAAYALAGVVVGGREIDEVLLGAEEQACVLRAVDAFTSRRGRSRIPCRCTSRDLRWGACQRRRRDGRARCADGRSPARWAGRSGRIARS